MAEGTRADDALVFGEALVDVVRRPGEREQAYAGGSAANVAVALARLGRPVRFATCFADDEHGRLIAEHLAVNGVSLAGDPHTVPRTSTAHATIGEDGAASYEFDLDWRPAPPPGPAPLVVHTSSFAAVLPPGGDTVAEVVAGLRDAATISYDVNVRPSVTGTGPDVLARVEHLVGLADVVKASDEDVEALWPGRSLSDCLHHLAGLGPALVLVTRGAEGARFVAGGAEGVVPAVAATVVDTIGAGDTFGAGLVDALWTAGLLGADRRSALRDLGADDWVGLATWAARAAAVTVSRAGADPPRREEIA